MKNLFRPAMFLMGRLRYTYKFGLIFLVVLIPLLILGIKMVSAINDEIRLLQNEQQGLAYIKVVRQPLEHIQQHRGMTAVYLNGAAHFRDRIMNKRGDVDKYMATLQQVDKELGEAMKTAGLVSALQQQWDHIKANSMNQEASAAIKAHTTLVTGLLDLMRHVADASDITLDPHLDSSYMGAALVSGLPKVIENMGQARAVASGIAAKGEFTPQNFVRLSVLANNIESYFKDVRSGLKSGFEANPAIKQELGVAVDANNKAIEDMQALLRDKLLEAEKITVDSNTVFNTATLAISGSYKLYDAIVPKLEGLFISRIEADMAEEYVEIGLIVGVLAIVLYLFVGLYLSVVGNIAKVGEVTQDMANGKLKTRLVMNTRDEMQQIAIDFNDMAEKFEALVQQIVSATAQLASAAEEVSTVASESSQNIGNQSSETEQIATAMNEMTATVQEVASNAANAAGAANNADNEAKAGKQVVEQTSQAIQQLAEDVERAAQVIHKLEQDSENIGSVLDVIKGIAEQTNLLALNAAIEAARAGEHGRGFAVVADEVRTLASRTQQSTDEIQDMIEKLQGGARNAVEVMEQGRSQAQTGVEQAKDAADSLEAIARAVATINEMNTMIASAAEEQSATAEEMNRGIVNINELTQNTSTGAEQTTASSQELSKLAIQLQSLVAQFKI